MEITISGYVFLTVCFIGLILPIKYLIAVLICSSVFSGIGVVNFQEKGIPPYVISMIFFIVKYVFSQSNIFKIKFDPFIYHLIVLAFYIVTITLMLPLFWNGLKIIQDNVEIDSVHFTVGNLIQAAYLIVNSLGIYCIYRIRHKITAEFIIRIFRLTVIIVLFVGFWEFFAKTTSLVFFPSTFFYNNTGYALLYSQTTMEGLSRLNSTFIEPSYCGAFLSASFWAILALGGRNNVLLAIFTAIALILNLSGTGMMSFVSGLVIYGYIKGIKKLFWLAPVALIIIYTVYSLDYSNNIIEMLTTKKDTISGYERMNAFNTSVSMFFKTYGTGIGLGTFRSLDFISGTLASIGIAGLIIFLKFYSYLIRYTLHTQNQWLFCFAIVLLTAQCIAIPDFSFSIMWMCLYMATILLPDKKRTARKEINTI
jgi:hypothetical protein